MQYEKKRFTVFSDGEPLPQNVMSDEDRAKLDADTREAALQGGVKVDRSVVRKIIPFGDRILVQRVKVGGTLGSGILIAPDHTADNETELAEIVYIPDATTIDDMMALNTADIINGLTLNARGGDSAAIVALQNFNKYLKIRALKVGDRIFMSKYVGTNFTVQETGQKLTLVDYDGIIGLVVEQ